jgi:mono/diheme cytochrome c family protein
MSRGLFNLVVDTLAAALLTAMVGTGYILWFALPPGMNRTHGLWGLRRHDWGAIHFWIAATLLAVLAVHVALHWRWLVTGLCRRFRAAAWAERSPRLAGLAVLAAAALPLTVLALAAHLSVRPLEAPLHALADRPAAAGPDALAGPVATLLAGRCAPCHGAREPAGGVRADSPGALRAEQNGVRWIEAGRPDGSRLLQVVGVPAADRDIPAQHRVTAAELEVLRAWIASLGG